MTGAILAIDHGTKRTGFAIADALRISSCALETWRGPGGGPELLEHIDTLLLDREVSTFVVGLPLNMDGSEGPRADETRAFMKKLAARHPGIEVVAQDERLSTKEAEELLRDAGHRGREARQMRDSWSALVILRDWLRAQGG